MNIINQFPNLTKTETSEILAVIENEVERLKKSGYKTPHTCVLKTLATVGISGVGTGTMYIHPPRDMNLLRFVVAHEIGHYNEPEVEFDLWNMPTAEQSRQASEDFANWFAANI